MASKQNDMVRYYFGRLNLVYSRNNTSKSQLLWNSLKSSIFYEKRNYRWGFFEVDKIQINGFEFFCGYLVKYQKEGIEAIVNENSKTLEETKINLKRKGQCLFALDPITGIIIYNNSGSNISVSLFNNIFCELLEEANERFFFNAEITAINDDFSIEKILDDFDYITKLSFVLHPSNPSNRDAWKKTDEKIRNINAEQYYEEYRRKSDNKGLKIEKGSEPYNNILMAIDGYGVAHFYGRKDGKIKRKSTKKEPKSVYAPKDSKEDMITSVFDAYKSIISRFNQ